MNKDNNDKSDSNNNSKGIHVPGGCGEADVGGGEGGGGGDGAGKHLHDCNEL